MLSRILGRCTPRPFNFHDVILVGDPKLDHPVPHGGQRFLADSKLISAFPVPYPPVGYAVQFPVRHFLYQRGGFLDRAGDRLHHACAIWRQELFPFRIGPKLPVLPKMEGHLASQVRFHILRLPLDRFVRHDGRGHKACPVALYLVTVIRRVHPVDEPFHVIPRRCPVHNVCFHVYAVSRFIVHRFIGPRIPVAVGDSCVKLPAGFIDVHHLHGVERLVIVIGEQHGVHCLRYRFCGKRCDLNGNPRGSVHCFPEAAP